MSSTAAEPPPGVPPGGQAGDPNTGPQTSARSSSQQGPHSEHSDGEDVGGDDTCGRLDLRPPVPGEEDLQRSHHVPHGEWGKEPPGSGLPPYSDWGKEPPGPHLPQSADWGKDSPGDWAHKPFNPLAGAHHLCAHFQGEVGGDFPAVSGGSVEGGSPCFGGGEGGTTPPAVRWSESLLQLLEDSHGVQLFTEFLKEECGSCESLQFWFACNGLRKSNKQDPSQLVTIIWKRYIRNFVVRVSEKTYKMVNDRINARSIDRCIFDDAQREVEEEMARSTYPSFLKSERYLTYLAAATQHTGGDSPHTPSPCSPGASGLGGSGVLPTLHEDCEYEGNIGNTQLRLTQGALAATVKQRAAAERRKPEAFAGQYLHGISNCGGGGGVNPYHALYATAHASSRQDSELQSLSSDALTDDTLSCTDSSVDGMSVGLGGSINPKHLKRQYFKMRENARQNRELALSAATVGFSGSQSGGILHGGVPFMPRTHRLRHEPIPNMKPREFAALLIEKLDKVMRDRESQEKVQQSFKKIQEGDNVSDECRREHAFNSLPPSLLLDKLAQKISLDDADPCQSILDEHVSRVWQDSNNDTPARSPGSPRPKSPSGRRSGSLQPSRPTVLSHHGPKGGVMVGVGHPSMFVSGTNFLPSTQGPHPLHVPAGHRAHFPPGHPAHLPPGHMPNPYQANKSWHHPRRRDRGQDVYSTFSSDSGNVADYNESTDRSGGLHPLPKSRSMPEYMENYAGTSSDGGSSGRRQQSRRNNSRRAPADLTDSGVSVVSDSGPSVTPSTSSTERVTSWLLESDKFSGSVSSASGFPEHEWDPRCRGSRSTHTAAGATSPGTLRRSSSSGGRRSVSGGSLGGGGGISASSISGSGSLGGSSSLVVGRPGSMERTGSSWMPGTTIELSGIHPAHMMYPPPHQSHGSHSSHSTTHDDSKRRSRGAGSGCHGSSRCASHNSGHSSGHNWSHSEGSSGRQSCHGDAAAGSGSNPSGPGSNGSTLRKQRPSRHSQPTPPGAVYESGGSSSGGSGGGGSVSGGGGGVSASGGTGSAASASESTTIVYNFHDDAVPFVIRVPTRPVTLKRFKQHLPKKGNYRFFFKKHCEEFGVIQEEITDESETIPLFEGKINAQIRKAD